jgi:hypothetical protein
MYVEIIQNLSEPWLKEKLTQEERASLLVSITESLEWDEFNDIQYLKPYTKSLQAEKVISAQDILDKSSIESS